MKKMLMPQSIHKKLDEQGFASIVIALILIIVLALFTVGFAQLARREQRSSLDKQLATQAYYAAESGINDAKQQLPGLQAAAAAGHAPDPDKCLTQFPSGHTIPATVGPAQNGVQYTCVLVNLKPPSIVYDGVQAEAQQYIVSSATSASGAGAASITVNWGSADGNSTFADNMNDGFTPAATDWNTAKHPAVIQFSLTPLGSGGALDSATLVNNTFTAYLYPVKNGPGSVAYNTVNQPSSTNGSIVAANCNTANGTTYPCRATITGLTGGTGDYLFRVIAHYDPTNISINGKDSLGKPVGFPGQIIIDVTGKAHEVLKRLQIHTPLKPSYDIPKDALDSQSTCKHFTTDPLASNGFQDQPLGQDTTGACAFSFN